MTDKVARVHDAPGWAPPLVAAPVPTPRIAGPTAAGQWQADARAGA
jgi:hypothetical protein